MEFRKVASRHFLMIKNPRIGGNKVFGENAGSRLADA